MTQIMIFSYRLR